MKQAERDSEQGVIDLTPMLAAKIELNTFERDCAETWKQKQHYPKKIVDCEKKWFDFSKILYKSGDSKINAVEIIRIENKYLAARQKLLLIEKRAKMNKNGGG